MQPTNPTPTPTPAPPVLEPVIEMIRAQRESVGYALLVASIVFLALTGWLGLETRKMSAPGPDATKDAKDKGEDPFKPAKLDGAEVTQPDRVDYIIGAVVAFLAFVAFAAVGGFLLAKAQPPAVEAQRTQARQVLLTIGSLAGAVLIIAGGLYFYQWSGSLVKWLDLGELNEARWVVIPLLMVVAGGALMFVSAQPARAEERNNATIRQFIYGSNFALTVLMMFVVLVIVNAVIAMRVPNKLDTTSTSFYTLNPQTKQLLEGLEQPIRAYAIFQDSGDAVSEDTKRLLTNCQETNAAKFKVTFLSPALNRDAINKLRSDYPLAEMSGEGILLVAGDEASTDRKRHSFIRDDELRDRQDDGQGRQVPAFNGEPKLLRELMFLAESKQKPKIYFTQSSGELSFGGGGERGGNSKRTAAVLKSYLEKNYFEVAELTFGIGDAVKVPDDAAVVVIADPTAPIPAGGVEAIRKFMTDPRPDGKKGKLVVLAGQQPGADQKPLKIGIEPMLQTFGVRFTDRFMYNVPTDRADPRDRDQGSRVTLAVINPEGTEARNPVALGFAANVERLPLLDCREVASSPAGGFQPVTILSSMPGRSTWTTATYAASPVEAWRSVNERAKAIVNSKAPEEEKDQQLKALGQEIQMHGRPRHLAIFVSEGDKARVAVFGCGWFVSDDASGRMGQDQSTTVWLDLMGATLDWIRDRPSVSGISQKPYTTYTLKPGYDNLRMLWVPLALAVLVVGAFGAGVWVVRRK